MTPERIAALEAAAAEEERTAQGVLESMLAAAPDGEPVGARDGNGGAAAVTLDEEASPVAGRRFSRS
jgi:hypothetical protein